MLSQRNIILGGHIPFSKGPKSVYLAAKALQYNAVQVMPQDKGTFNPYRLTETEVEEAKRMAVGLTVVVHLPFNMNPCESDRRLRQIYKGAYVRYRNVAKQLDARYMVLHPGFKKELTEPQAFQNLKTFLQEVGTDDGPKLLLETDAGSKNGSAVGSLEFIVEMLKLFPPVALGMCLDTTHLYARGVDMWDDDEREQVLMDYGERINLIHLNVPDPEVDLGSNKDRHNSPFNSFSKDSKKLVEDLAKWPLILERSSLAVQNQDAGYIRKILGLEESIIGRTREEPRGTTQD